MAKKKKETDQVETEAKQDEIIDSIAEDVTTDAVSGDTGDSDVTDESGTDASAATDPADTVPEDSAPDDTPPEDLSDEPVAEDLDEPSESATLSDADTGFERDRLAPQVQQIEVYKGGFFPMVLGGLVAGTLGFGVARYVDGGWPFAVSAVDPLEAVTVQLDAQDRAISDINARLAEVSDSPDSAALEAATQEIQEELVSLQDQIAALASTGDTFDSRISELEKRPMTTGVSAGAVAAYEAEMKALQDAVAKQRQEIEGMAVEAAKLEENAQSTAEETLFRAAMMRLQTALDTGQEFTQPLSDIGGLGLEIPEVLSRLAETGAPTLTDLQGDFPKAARLALESSRKVTDEGAGLGSFLKSQFGVRSLEPREGDDPDAVLSRAEAAVREGRLTDALAEIDTLPETGRADLTDWMGLATDRISALDAVTALSNSFTPAEKGE